VGLARAVAGPALIAALLCGCAHRAAVRPERAARSSGRSQEAARAASDDAGPVPVATEARQAGVFHRVRAGETLWRIARTYAVTPEAVARENALPDGSQLSEGMRLFIPGAARELAVPPQDSPKARSELARRRLGPTEIPRAGARPLDPAAGGAALGWPTRGVLISGFGTRQRDEHDGIDLAAPAGSPIVAAGSGVVLFSGEQRGYGRLVIVSHPADLVTVYAHNEENLVRSGDAVERGQLIARVGRSGNATGPHLHFEVRVRARPHDPLGFLR
jgi:lipoprotein NlpD